MPRHCVIVGSGIGGLAAAVQLAHQGYTVTVLEKNEQPGGRAGVFSEEGFRFDMGPSWYLMPEVFEKFFTDLGEDITDYLTLEKLSPSYRVYFEKREKPVDIYSDAEKDAATFESLEPGSAHQLRRYLRRAKRQYQIILDNFLYARFDKASSLFTKGSLPALRHVPLLGTMQKYVERYFHSPELQKLMQYTLVFLGSSPYNAPAMYNIMSHMDFTQGVFYPRGGIHEIVGALLKLADKYGVEIKCNQSVREIEVVDGKATAVVTEDGTRYEADVILSNADVHFTETKLLPPKARQFSAKHWEKRVLAPSALLIYLGVEGELPELLHHTLYFSDDWQKNFSEIFDEHIWPTTPSIYISNPTKTDPTVAPKGMQNVFILVPLGAHSSDTDAQREAYCEKVFTIVEDKLKIPDFRSRIVYKKLFGPRDFASRYNSMGGTALGEAHTLLQTAFGRTSSRSKKVSNLYYVGSTTHPGIGMPVCLISAHIATERVNQEYPC